MASPKTHHIGVVMNGVTSRMGTNQHLIRSICAIRKQGGVKAANDDIILPDPILVGRNPTKLQELAASQGIEKWTTDLDIALDDPANMIYFDAQTTSRRFEAVKKAINKGKHIYCEKPSAASTAEALDLYKAAKAAGVKNGVVQDKLWLPGLIKLRSLVESGFFGDILSVRGEFGYWVFDGKGPVAPQRPSWNYKREEGGGIISDMLCHWQYVIQNLFGEIRSLTCLGATHVKERVDEDGNVYKCTADDSAYATFELKNGVIVHFNSSWTVRVHRDELLNIQVDGTKGSAVAGLRCVYLPFSPLEFFFLHSAPAYSVRVFAFPEFASLSLFGIRNCSTQHEGQTPRPTWNPDIESPMKFMEGWSRTTGWQVFDNAFKAQWELFLKHVVNDEPFVWTLFEGAKGVQLTELAEKSWQKRTWVDVEPLE